MRTRLIRRASAGALALTLISSTAALASDVDVAVVDVTVPNSSVTLAPGATGAITINLSVTGSQAGTATFEVYRDWTLSGGTFAGSNPQEFTVSPRSGGDPATTFNTSGTVSVASGQTAGTFALEVGAFDITNSNATGAKLAVGDSSNYAVTVVAATNTAPSTPANVVASPATSKGGVTVSWGASTDTQGDAFTYTLEGKDGNDLDYSQMAAGLTGTSYTFGAADPAEGTWTFRVKAVETSTSPALSSEYGVSNAAVVDRSAPNPPVASPSSDPDYVAPGGTKWWADGVDVSFVGDGDPALLDTSAGSGVASTTGPFAIATHGPFSVQGTAMDWAENISEPTTFSGAVDAISPELTITCPAAPVYFGDTALATWSATDDGSGVKGATSGTLPINTSATGDVVVGTIVEDNVGHETSRTATCSVLSWTAKGFYAPVDMNGVWNTVKSGSTVPLKFEVFKGDTEIVDVSKVSVTKAPIACTSGLTDAIETLATSTTTGLRYDVDGGQFIENWKTPKGSTGCYAVTMTAADGSSFTAKFQLK